MAKKKILILSEKRFEEKVLSGIELRTLQIKEFFQTLNLEVIIAVPAGPWLKKTLPDQLTWTQKNLKTLTSNFDFIFTSLSSSDHSVGHFLTTIDTGARYLVDVYTPLLLEKTSYLPKNEDGEATFATILERVKSIVLRADFFVCTSVRQRYYSLGMLEAFGRLGPAQTKQDIISIIPFLPPKSLPWPPPKIPPHFPKLIKSHFNLLWFGGFYPWFETDSLITAMRLLPKHVRLVIIGAKNPKTKSFDANFVNFLNRAKASQVYPQRITLIDWLPYQQMDEVLSQGDASICLSKNGLEDELAFRIRFLSVLKNNLPLITNGRDEISDLVGRLKVGVHLPKATPAAIAAAVLSLDQGKIKRNKIWRRVETTINSWTDTIALRNFLDS